MNNKLIRSQEVVWQELGDQALLVHVRTGQRWTLNTLALAFWKLCDGTRTVESLAAALAATTRWSLADCRDELERFTRVLNGTGLLQGAAKAESWSAQPAQLSNGMLRAIDHGKSLGGPRRRPSPRGNSGPG